MNFRKSVLEMMDDMVKKDNKGIMMSTIITGVDYDYRGAKVSFGVEKEIGQQAELEKDLKLSEYMFMCFAVKKSELEKYVTEGKELN